MNLTINKWGRDAFYSAAEPRPQLPRERFKSLARPCRTHDWQGRRSCGAKRIVSTNWVATTRTCSLSMLFWVTGPAATDELSLLRSAARALTRPDTAKPQLTGMRPAVAETIGMRMRLTWR